MVLFLCMGIHSHAIGQKDRTDTLPPARPGSQAQVSELYFDAIKAKMHEDSKKAEELLQQVIAINAGIPSVYYELSVISYADKNLEQADKYIQQALKLSPDNKWYKEHRASILADKGAFAEAGAIMGELARTEKDDRTYPLIAAEYFDRARMFDDAIKYLDMALARDVHDVEILMRKAQIYRGKNEVEKAAEVIKLIIAEEPENGKFYKLLGELYDNNGQSKKAGEVYEDAKNKLPGDPFVLLGVAEHYLKIGDTAAYNESVKKAITSTDFDVRAQIDILGEYLKTMPGKEAYMQNGLPIIRQIVAQHPNDVDALTFFGGMLYDNDQQDSAAMMFKKAVAVKPADFNTWDLLFRAYGEAKYADSLIKYTEKAMRLFPNLAAIHYYNSIGHINKKNYGAAAKAMNRAIDLQPESNKALLTTMYTVLGDTYHQNRQDDLAFKAYDKALALSPNDAGVLNNYAYYLSEKGMRLDEAEKMSKKSLEVSPKLGTYLDTYGWIMYKQGNFEKAREYVQQAIDAAGADADATLYDHMGNIWYKLNNKDKAVESWKKSKEKGGDDPQLDKKINEGKLYE